MHDTHVVDLGVQFQNLVENQAFDHFTSRGQDSTVPKCEAKSGSIGQN